VNEEKIQQDRQDWSGLKMNPYHPADPVFVFAYLPRLKGL
jgi:hypothetical protein